MNNKKNTLLLTLSMVIFGTIGIFRRYIPLPSGRIAFLRGITGFLFLLIFVFVTKKKISFSAIKSNLLLLILSGVFIGFNWILLFEAYQYTTVATATLCYYMQPIFVILASPVFLREKFTVKKMICTLIAFGGMILISGIITENGVSFSGTKGILLGLGAAILYSGVVIINKKMKNIGAYDKTIVQLLVAGIVILPYSLIFEKTEGQTIDFKVIAMILIVGIVHTGIAYALYFGSMNDLKAQTVALFGYIDPVVAIILSAAILKEEITFINIIGAILVLGSTCLSEIEIKSLKKSE